MKRIVFMIVVLVVEGMSSGCAISIISPAIQRYKKVQHEVKLEDSKDKVLSILLPTQKNLGSEYTKSPSTFMHNGVKTEIYYMRSKIIHDDLTTDKEFTPYIFKNAKLHAIGWKTLGGPKSGNIKNLTSTSDNQ